MKKSEIENRIKNAVASTVSVDVDTALSECGKQADVLPLRVVKPRKTVKIAAAVVAACLAIVIMTGFGLIINRNTIVSTVSIDVNPSVELKVNSHREVLECNPINGDAEDILSGIESQIKGADLSDAVNTIVNALVNNGYIDGLSSTILVSVEDKNQNRAGTLEADLSKIIGDCLLVQSTSAEIVTQVVEDSDKVNSISDEYSISHGKAKMVESVSANHPDWDMGEVAGLTVKELKQIEELNIAKLPIGSIAAQEAARKAAAAYAGDSNFNVHKAKPHLDEETPYYSVKINVNGDVKGNIEYEIDAFTGAIITLKTNMKDKKSETSGQNIDPADFIGEDKAKEIALKTAGFNESDVSNLYVYIEYDDGIAEYYEVQFESGNVSYKYKIDLVSGKVLEKDNKSYNGKQNKNTEPQIDIGEEKAKEIAFSKAGLSSDKVEILKTEIKPHGKKLEYIISFSYENTEYNITVNGYTEEIIKYKVKDKTLKEKDNGNNGKDKDTDKIGKNGISGGEAKKIALAAVGLTESQVSEINIEFTDTESGDRICNVSFILENKTYKYEISSIGEIIKHDVVENIG